MPPKDRVERVRRFYDEFADEYHASRYSTPEQQRLDALAKAVVVNLLDGRPMTGRRVLDCGCGTGRFSELFSELGADVLGIDSSPRMLEVARARVPKARFEVGDVFRLESHGRFDLVICSQVLTHLHEYEGPLRSMKGVLREDGEVIVDIRNLLSVRNVLSVGKANLRKLIGRTLDYDPGYTTLGHIRAACGRIGLQCAAWRGLTAEAGEAAGRSWREAFAQTLVLKLRAADRVAGSPEPRD